MPETLTPAPSIRVRVKGTLKTRANGYYLESVDGHTLPLRYRDRSQFYKAQELIGKIVEMTGTILLDASASPFFDIEL